jgi:hypothetical protein
MKQFQSGQEGRLAGEQFSSKAVRRQTSPGRSGPPPGSANVRAVRFTRLGVTAKTCCSSDKTGSWISVSESNLDCRAALVHSPMAASDD